MIEKVRSQAIADKGVSAVLMYGSFANGEADRYSDIEFYIFLEDGYLPDKKEWIARIHPVSLFYTNEFGTDVAVFENLIRGEFHFHPISEISMIHSWQGALDFSISDKMNLVDKDGLLTDTLDKIEQIRPEWNTRENTAWVADSMINNLLFVGNVIRRGEYARAVHLFFFLEKYLSHLIRLHIGTTDHWLDPMKGLEKDIPAELYKRYTACIPKLDGDDLQKCYIQVLNLTNELFRLLDIPSLNKSVLSRIMSEWI